MGGKVVKIERLG